MSTTKFIQLEEELKEFYKIMAKASDAIIDQEISRYPIFVVHQHEVEIGVLLIDGVSIGLTWSVNASSLEEFVSKQIIQNEKADDFIKIYKDSKKFFCCFVLSELGANFVFLPRESKNTENQKD